MDHLDFERFYSGRRVLVTGDTGFTGSWLVAWLSQLGVELHGVALPAETPSLFRALNAHTKICHHDADIRALDAMRRLIGAAAPHIVFHLAAQPLVNLSYANPCDTYSTNVMGTANVLEACRGAKGLEAIVAITTDKVYRNNEWLWGYRESDALGGADPYSASKAACEIVISSFRESFFAKSELPVGLAAARAGNIIGGGDWARDRIVPDIVRAICDGAPLTLRNPQAIRPWQHVLSACHGYLLIGAGLLERRAGFDDAWNFGPDASDDHTVAEVVNGFGRAWRAPELRHQPSALKETRALKIDAQRARHLLGWRSAWDFDETVRRTARWYRDFYVDSRPAAELCAADLDAYRAALAARAP